MHRYLPLTAVLLAFWLGRETGAEGGERAGVARFGVIEARKIVLRSRNETGKHTAVLRGDRLEVFHSDSSRTIYGARGLMMIKDERVLVSLAADRQLNVYDAEGAPRVTLGLTPNVDSNKSDKEPGGIAFVQLRDATGKTTARLPR